MSSTVLVCDDAVFMRTMVSDILSQAGFTVVGEAENGKQAVEKYQQLKPDLVTMDIVMPDMSGDELARELRKARPNLRVVYMTGYSGDLDTATLRIDGPVVQKPFTRDTLVAAVEGALAEKR